MQAFEDRTPTAEVTAFEQEPIFNPELIEHQTPPLNSKSELTPDTKRIKDLIEGNAHGTLATNDGKMVLRAISFELGLLDDDVNARISAAEYYYEENFWDDYNNRTGLDLDALTNLEETGLYDKTEVFDDCDLLDTIATLRRTVVHIDVVSDADRLARILLLHEAGEIDIQPYMPQQEDPEQSTVN